MTVETFVCGVTILMVSLVFGVVVALPVLAVVEAVWGLAAARSDAALAASWGGCAAVIAVWSFVLMWRDAR